MKLGDHWRNSEDGKKQAAPKWDKWLNEKKKIRKIMTMWNILQVNGLEKQQSAKVVGNVAIFPKN